MKTQQRERLSMDFGWKFHRGDLGQAAAKSHDETYMSVKAGGGEITLAAESPGLLPASIRIRSQECTLKPIVEAEAMAPEKN